MDFELSARCPFPHFRLGSQLLSGGRVFNGAGSEQEFSRARPVKQRDCLPQWLAAPGEWGLGPDSAHHRIWPSRLPGSSRVPEPHLLCSVWIHLSLLVSVSPPLSVFASPPPSPVVTCPCFSCPAQSRQSTGCSFPGVPSPYLPGSCWPWPGGTGLVNSSSPPTHCISRE